MNREMRKSTAWDVAERAGVSQSTVSRVFTGSVRISAPTRDRVLQAARDLDYAPDKRASRLRSGQTGVIAVVVVIRSQDSAQEINPFAYILLGSVCRAASARGYETLVSFQASEDEFYGRYVERREADALIVLGTTQNPPAWEYFRPLLQSDDSAICWGLPFDEANSIRSDNRRGGQLVAEHLWQQGYRQPVFLGPIDSEQRQFHERYQGFVEGWAAHSIKPGLIHQSTSRDRFQQGYDAAKHMLESDRECDCIFAACDFIAIGAQEALSESGVNMPQQIGIVGFDGLAAAAHASPPLTTIKPDLEEAGRQLVSSVLGEDEEAGSALAPVELIARQSTRRG